MMLFDCLIWAIWAGGLVPAYRHARRNKHRRLSAITQAAIWPADVGWRLADWACDGPDKG